METASLHSESRRAPETKSLTQSPRKTPAKLGDGVSMKVDLGSCDTFTPLAMYSLNNTHNLGGKSHKSD